MKNVITRMNWRLILSRLSRMFSPGLTNLNSLLYYNTYALFQEISCRSSQSCDPVPLNAIHHIEYKVEGFCCGVLEPQNTCYKVRLFMIKYVQYVL